MSEASKGSEFRALHHRERPFVIPNPWDIGSARILARQGFEALATTSAGLAFSLGLRDGGVTEQIVLSHCRDIVAATDLPVSADLEKGFGDTPESAAETVRKAAATGLAGCSIEDYTGPDDPQIFEFDLAVERIAAAAEAASNLDRDFVLTARSENFLHGRPDLDDTIKRLLAFEEAGADVLYAPGLREIEQISQVCSAVSQPVNVVVGMAGANFSVEELAAVGAKRISLGSTLARVAYGGLIRAGEEMRDHGRFDFVDGTVGYGDIQAYFSGPGG